MQRTRIKICGITRLEDALLACELGADAIGLVMTPSSPRCVLIDRALTIRQALPPFVSAVAVVVDQDSNEIQEIISKVRPDLLQFHGKEAAVFCESFDVPYIKAFSMNEAAADPIEVRLQKYGSASAFMLDGRNHDQAGGGMAFDWGAIPKCLARPLILAGGLNASNATAAIEQVNPYALDVSSGVEAAPGIKDRSKLQEFFLAVGQACGERLQP